MVGSLSSQEKITRNLLLIENLKIHKKIALGKVHKKYLLLAFGSAFVGSEIFLSRKLHVPLKNCFDELTTILKKSTDFFKCWYKQRPQLLLIPATELATQRLLVHNLKTPIAYDNTTRP